MTTMEKTKEEQDSNNSEAHVAEVQKNTFLPRADVIEFES